MHSQIEAADWTAIFIKKGMNDDKCNMREVIDALIWVEQHRAFSGPRCDLCMLKLIFFGTMSIQVILSDIFMKIMEICLWYNKMQIVSFEATSISL